MSSKMGLCFFKFKPQKLTRAVWFSSPYSTSFNITSLTMYIRSLYELGEPDIFITLFSLLLACQVCDNSNHNITCVNISTSIYLLSLCLSLSYLCVSVSLLLKLTTLRHILIICRHILNAISIWKRKIWLGPVLLTLLHQSMANPPRGRAIISIIEHFLFFAR